MTTLAGASLPARLRDTVRGFDRALLAINRAAMIAALAAMAVIVFVGVLLRYLTNDAILWAEELSRYLMVWLTFIGVGPVLRLGGALAVDNLHAAMIAKVRMQDLHREVYPMLAVQLVVLVLLTFVPASAPTYPT